MNGVDLRMLASLLPEEYLAALLDAFDMLGPWGPVAFGAAYVAAGEP